MVLKQCGQVVTILRSTVSTPSNRSLIVSTVWAASCWNRNSLPERRAGSPLQVSPVPSTRNFTPAAANSSATALTVFLARSSNAPAQPTVRVPRPVEEVLQQVDRVVQVPAVHRPAVDVDLSREFGPERSPVPLEDEAQVVVIPPVRGHGRV